MLPRQHRLTRSQDFTTVLRREPGSTLVRRRAGTDLLVVHAALTPQGAPSPTRPPRVGFVVSKAVGNSVVRHRVYRRLRAVLAARLDRLPAGADLVVRAAPAAASATSAELGSAVDAALARVLKGVEAPAGAPS